MDRWAESARDPPRSGAPIRLVQIEPADAVDLLRGGDVLDGRLDGTLEGNHAEKSQRWQKNKAIDMEGEADLRDRPDECQRHEAGQNKLALDSQRS